MSALCERCEAGAKGEQGHDALDFYVSGPYPGQNIFKCLTCDERWIRHYGGASRFGWTRYSVQFPANIRKPQVPSAAGPLPQA